jgi:hypothetical protein
MTKMYLLDVFSDSIVAPLLPKEANQLSVNVPKPQPLPQSTRKLTKGENLTFKTRIARALSGLIKKLAQLITRSSSKSQERTSDITIAQYPAESIFQREKVEMPVEDEVDEIACSRYDNLNSYGGVDEDRFIDTKVSLQLPLPIVISS